MSEPVWFKIAMILSLTALACSPNTGPRVLYTDSLNSTDAILTKDGVTLDNKTFYGSKGAIRIDSRGPTTVRLAEIQPEGVEGAVLTFRGHLRTANLAGRAYLELTCNASGKEIVSESVKAPPSRTTDWVTHETRLSLHAGQHANVVKLNVVIEGAGTVWVDNVILVQTQG